VCETNVREGEAAYAEETFGPVVSLYPVKDEDEAIAKANDSDCGLNSSVRTSDGERSRRVSTQLQAATIAGGAVSAT
jgi:succinate-semialdehyde dehydrogenase/glutarate-semialdehyde dehydrogenase